MVQPNFVKSFLKIFQYHSTVQWFFLTWVAIFLTACQQLPVKPHSLKSQLLTQQSQQLQPKLSKKTDLIQQISQTAPPTDKNLSGYYPIITSRDAFASRSMLTDLAKHSIDIQYYIWHNDEAGQLMLKQLYDMANRGVKVRLLLDDLNTDSKIDQLLLAFASHPNIAVRYINPKIIRSLTPANFAVAMPRYHRRMHNKSMTFDKQLSIIGGRNIGNEYLRSDTKNEFSDLDVLLAGKVVDSINDSFEQYWNSPISYDIENLVLPYEVNNKTNKIHMINTEQRFFDSLDKIKKNEQWFHSQDFYQAPTLTVGGHHQALNEVLHQKKLDFRWAKIDFFADNVQKLLKKDNKSERLVEQLRESIGTPKHDFTVVSSYFVPTNRGIKELNQLVADGVNVTILTNSFDSTDVPTVHVGYSEARLPLLKAGVKLYELKSSAGADLRIKKPRLSRNEISTSLHTKAFAVDDRLAFIGSYNVDPRSANINTELGVVIYDPALAKAMHKMFDDNILNISYKLMLSDKNRIVWQTLDEDRPIVLNKANEPRLSLVNSTWIRIFSVLPIQWLL